MQNVKINTLSKLNLQPLQELLNREVDVDELIQHLDLACFYFAQNTMKVSYSENAPIYEQEIVCLYWIERLKQMFKEMIN